MITEKQLLSEPHRMISKLFSIRPVQLQEVTREQQKECSEHSNQKLKIPMSTNEGVYVFQVEGRNVRRGLIIMTKRSNHTNVYHDWEYEGGHTMEVRIF